MRRDVKNRSILEGELNRKKSRHSLSFGQPLPRDSSLGYPCMEYANESRDKRLEQYGVNERPVQQRQRADVLLNGYKSFRSAQTAKHATQFPVTAAKRKRSKASVPCSSLKRFCQRIAQRGEYSAETSGQLRMVCRSWPRCSGATSDRFQFSFRFLLDQPQPSDNMKK